MGPIVINNPFWWTADDKFFNYALATKLGVAIPPHRAVCRTTSIRQGTTDQSMRNLMYPLNWDGDLRLRWLPGFSEALCGGGWKNVYKVHSPEEFFQPTTRPAISA